MKVAYIVVMFPCYSETFVLGELLELERRGVDLTILSLRSFTEKIMDERAKSFLPRILYSPYLFSWGLLRSNFYFLFKEFRVYMGLIGFLLSKLILHPKELVKNLSLFPKSVHFARLVKKMEVEHIHAHFSNYPATAALIISRLTGIPFTVTAHAHDIFKNQLLLPDKLGYAKKLFTISGYNRRFILEKCRGIPADKIEVVHCGVDPSRLPRLASGERGAMIFSVGRLMAIKGFDTLIRACAVLNDQVKDIRCVIAGDGPEMERLRRLIEKHSLEGVVEMVGEINPQEVLKLMSGCSIFVLPSRPAGKRSGVMDGIPVSIVEAMAMGIPVVSCAVSGIPELVVDGETGLLVPPADEGKLANAIATLLGDKELRDRLGRAGREKVESEFNIGKSVNRLLEVFNQTIP